MACLLILLISVLLTWDFYQSCFLWDIIFVTTIFLISVSKFVFAKFFWLLIWSPLNCRRVNVPIVRSYHLCAIWIGLQHCYFSFLYWTFVFVDEFPFSIIHFLEILSGFITEKQAGNATTHFAVCAWITDVLWPITNRLWKNWCDWSLVMMCICYLHTDLWTAELAAKSVFYVIRAEVQSILGGNVFLNHYDWHPCMLKWMKSKPCLYCKLFSQLWCEIILRQRGRGEDTGN